MEVSVHDDKLESAKSPALSKSLSGLSYPPSSNHRFPSFVN